MQYSSNHPNFNGLHGPGQPAGISARHNQVQILTLSLEIDVPLNRTNIIEDFPSTFKSLDRSGRSAQKREIADLFRTFNGINPLYNLYRLKSMAYEINVDNQILFAINGRRQTRVSSDHHVILLVEGAPCSLLTSRFARYLELLHLISASFPVGSVTVVVRLIIIWKNFLIIV